MYLHQSNQNTFFQATQVSFVERPEIRAMLDRPFQPISSKQVLVYPFPLDAFRTLGWSCSETLPHPLINTCPLASSTLYDKLKDSKGKTPRKPALQEKRE